jgi:DNA (cytosine-5)-methyltransferase 1
LKSKIFSFCAGLGLREGKMKTLDLFSGIGGFSLAAHWMGWQTVAFVEKDEFCQQVLRKNFPNTDIYGDIREFTAQGISADVVCAGFPCQPHSNAGERKGKDDERYLFPQVIRVISTVKPKWIVLENVHGLLSQDSGELFEEICSSVEGEGYEIQPFIIPACAVGAPHKRNRLWLIAHADRIGRGYEQKERLETLPNEKRFVAASQQVGHVEQRGTGKHDSVIADADGFGLSGQGQLGQQMHSESSQEREIDRTFDANQFKGDWLEIAARLCRANDGISRRMDGHRKQRLRALGNSIVPQIAFEIFRAIEQAE